jgi:hypothetical protein
VITVAKDREKKEESKCGQEQSQDLLASRPGVQQNRVAQNRE